jgi:hypothetical protein
MSCHQESCETSCKTESCGGGSCGCGGGSCGSQKSGCPACGGACGGDPVACSMNMWKKAFFKAMHEVHVDLLKAKIQKNWGPMMEKGADLTLEAMGAMWQGMMNESKMKSEMREKFENLFKGGK